MATATYVRGEKRPVLYTAGADIAVDQILVLGTAVDTAAGQIGVALQAIASGATGFVATAGVWNVPKVSAGVIKAGEKVNYDSSEGKFDDNAHTTAAGDVKWCGMAMSDAGNGVTTIDLDISAAGAYDLA